jgi:hypothetical protein
MRTGPSLVNCKVQIVFRIRGGQKLTDPDPEHRVLELVQQVLGKIFYTEQANMQFIYEDLLIQI